MDKTRVEAFTDGVIAILITIMAFQLRVPHGTDLVDLVGLLPVFLTYVLSFLFLAIYWNSHHHMFKLVDRVSGSILWANLHLLFWLSLVPFATGWMGENHFASHPTAAYGAVLFMASIAYYVLERRIISVEGAHSRLRAAVGPEKKEILSSAMYLTGIAVAYFNHWISDALYIGVALMWLVPDRRIELAVTRSAAGA